MTENLLGVECNVPNDCSSLTFVLNLMQHWLETILKAAARFIIFLYL